MSTPASRAAPPAPGWRAFASAITWHRLALTFALAGLAALAIHPIFVTPFIGVLWRMLVVAGAVLLAFTAAGLWQPPGVPRWLNQVVAVVVAVPVATLLVYLALVGGQWANFVGNWGLVQGYVVITFTALVIAPMLAFGALYRERDAQARNQALTFELERSQLERQALDARLKLLHAQIEPHFLFNTLANVQALVESKSDRAAPLLQSLIAYLRAAMPQLDAAEATLGTEAALVRAYLELMHMRMPDRLRFDVRVAPELAGERLPSMALLTLVENAVHHGIDPAEQGGRIEVTAWRDAAGGPVNVAVVDTGIGLRVNGVHGTGLANLRARLLAFYGPGARLELSEVQPHGVRAQIVFEPVRGEAAR